MDRILVLGCGYVGTFLAAFYKKAGHYVTATTTTPLKVPMIQKIADEIVVCESNNTLAMADLFSRHDVVINCIGTKGQSNEEYRKAYVQTAQYISEAVRLDNSQVSKVIQLSSIAVYGDTNGEWVDEDSAYSGTGDYREVALQTAEQILEASTLASGHTVTILRLGGIYGPGKSLVDYFKDMSGLKVGGAGEHIVNWINVKDIIGAVEFVRANNVSGTYNLVDNSNFTAKEIIAQVCDHLKIEHPIWMPDWKGDGSKRRSICASNTKIKQMGYEFKEPYPVYEG